jgi:hypothetical protein
VSSDVLGGEFDAGKELADSRLAYARDPPWQRSPRAA